jgi:hypothetical protein
MQSEAFRKACLTATVAVAWAGSSSPAIAITPGGTDTVYIRTNANHTFVTARFVASDGLTWLSVDLGTLYAGEQYRTAGIGLGSGYSGDMWYTILGAGMGSGSGGGDFFAGFSDASGALGQPFETVFPGFNETQVVDAILTGGPALDNFIDFLMTRPANQISFGSTSPVVGFSNGIDAGTILADFNPIPEPGTAVVCLGALGIGMLRLRRSA